MNWLSGGGVIGTVKTFEEGGRGWNEKMEWENKVLKRGGMLNKVVGAKKKRWGEGGRCDSLMNFAFLVMLIKN